MVAQLSAPTSLTRALSNRAFGLLWGGQLLSRLGDFLYEIALASGGCSRPPARRR